MVDPTTNSKQAPPGELPSRPAPPRVLRKARSWESALGPLSEEINETATPEQPQLTQWLRDRKPLQQQQHQQQQDPNKIEGRRSFLSHVMERMPSAIALLDEEKATQTAPAMGDTGARKQQLVSSNEQNVGKPVRGHRMMHRSSSISHVPSSYSDGLSDENDRNAGISLFHGDKKFVVAGDGWVDLAASPKPTKTHRISRRSSLETFSSFIDNIMTDLQEEHQPR